MTGNTQRIVLVLALAAALLAPYLLSDFSLRLANLSLHAAIAVIGLCIAFGWAGLLHLGQAAFIGIGAYATAILSTRYGLGFWTTMPLALIISGLAAVCIAVPMLRLRGHYLALAVLGFNVTFEIVARNWTNLTGGFDGIGGIPAVSVFGLELDTDKRFYFLSLGFVVVVALFGVALRHSRYGRAMIAIRDDELAAGTSSISVTRTKVLAFVIASMLAGLSGALYAHHANFIAPQDFDFVRSVTILVMLILGGESSIIGAIIGAVILTFAPEWLRFVGDAYLAVFGIGVLLVLILMPTGIVGQFAKWSTKWGSRRQSGGDMTAAVPSDSILSVRRLTRRFGGLLAVSGVDLDLPRAKVLALIGPNGAGKSTTVNLLTGVLVPSEGSVALEGKELTGLSPSAIARAGLVRTFQNGRLFARLTVLENVMTGADGRSSINLFDAVARTPRFRIEEAQFGQQAMELLAELKLDGDANRRVGELPYGKQRKLEIARALIMQPRILLLDEPAAGLNSGEVEELIAYVSLLRERGLSILLIEHNMKLVMRLADRVAVLNFGQKIADGTPEQVRAEEQVIEAYLGRKKTGHAAG